MMPGKIVCEEIVCKKIVYTENCAQRELNHRKFFAKK